MVELWFCLCGSLTCDEAFMPDADRGQWFRLCELEFVAVKGSLSFSLTFMCKYSP